MRGTSVPSAALKTSGAPVKLCHRPSRPTTALAMKNTVATLIASADDRTATAVMQNAPAYHHHLNASRRASGRYICPQCAPELRADLRFYDGCDQQAGERTDEGCL